MLTYHGVLAPAARWRSRVVPERIISDLTLQPPPAPVMETSPPDTEPTPAQTSRSQEARRSWAILMKRVYELDVLECERCGGRMRVIGAIQDKSEVKKVLEHAGLPALPPRLKPARAPPELEICSAA